MSSPQVLQLDKLDLRHLHADLYALLNHTGERDAQILEALQLLLSLSHAAGAYYALEIDNEWQSGPRVLSKQALEWDAELEVHLKELVAEAWDKQEAVYQPVDPQAQIYLIASPVQADSPQGMAFIVVLGKQSLEFFVSILQLLSVYLSQTDTTIAPSPSNNNNDALLLNVLAQTLNAPHFQQAALRLLNHLQTQWGAQRVLLGIQKGRHCRLRVSSELTELPRKADLVHASEAIMDETLFTKQVLSSWMDEVPQSVRRLQNLSGSPALLSLPLLLPNTDDSIEKQNTPWAVLLIFAKDFKQFPDTEMWQRQAFAISLSLYTAQKLNPSRLTRWRRALLQKKGLAWLAAAGMLVFASTLPMTHHVDADVSLEAWQKRLVNAPFDSILKNTAVQPGDLVQSNTVLANLDEREFTWQLSSLQAEKNRAKKQKDVSRAERDPANVQIAELEIERLNAKIALLKHRMENLALKSPIDGLLISGDWQREAGKPLNKGEVLFEIAPLDDLRVQMQIAAEDISYVQTGQSMTLYLNAFPHDEWTLDILRIYPQASIVDAENVFILEARLANPKHALRPGLQGQAKIEVGKAPAYWVILHQFWYQILRWLH